MQKISDIMDTIKRYTPNTEDEKIEMYVKYAKSRIDFFTNLSKKLQDDIKVSELQTIASLEFYGGNCPRCSMSWIKTEFDNMFSTGSYFLPNCDCFYFCPYCETHLYDYEITGYLKNHYFMCPFCGWYLIFDENKRHGFEYARKIKKLRSRERLKLLLTGHKVSNK